MEAIDRISFLPNDLTHHIMSLLPMKDIARTSVLSKRWMSHWLCFSIQEFDESWFKGRRESCRRDFHEYLRRSLTRRDFDNMQELVKEAHISSIDCKAEDSSSSSLQLRVDDMACQLAPGGYVITCSRDN
ncbi:hypothetical protein WN944_024293 [Citrus x changshan-huyou]|uniref:F-box domain-containing protein n=1 Tax=Citrus x changshan-huyou TaxID=2935761 RepID=A0AAP0LND4_9ROSI